MSKEKKSEMRGIYNTKSSEAPETYTFPNPVMASVSFDQTSEDVEMVQVSCAGNWT